MRVIRLLIFIHFIALHACLAQESEAVTITIRPADAYAFKLGSGLPFVIDLVNRSDHHMTISKEMLADLAIKLEFDATSIVSMPLRTNSQSLMTDHELDKNQVFSTTVFLSRYFPYIPSGSAKIKWVLRLQDTPTFNSKNHIYSGEIPAEFIQASQNELEIRAQNLIEQFERFTGVPTEHLPEKRALITELSYTRDPLATSYALSLLKDHMSAVLFGPDIMYGVRNRWFDPSIRPLITEALNAKTTTLIRPVLQGCLVNRQFIPLETVERLLNSENPSIRWETATYLDNFAKILGSNEWRLIDASGDTILKLLSNAAMTEKSPDTKILLENYLANTRKRYGQKFIAPEADLKTSDF